MIYLDRTDEWNVHVADNQLAGLLARELLRQSLLIAAREELGLLCRDAWLGDALPTEGGNPPFYLGTGSDNPNRLEIRRGFPQHRELLATEPLELNQPLDYLALLVKSEQLARGKFVKVLREAGFDGKPRPVTKQADLPPQVETLLGEMTFTSQYLAARLLHEAIRDSGQSPALLGALVRAYANLGLLTESYWHPAHKAFKARALLYAQRMLSGGAERVVARWHRAYALALVGFHKLALDDLETAEKEHQAAKHIQRPAWVALLGPYCRFDPDPLKATAPESPHRGLGLLLRFQMLESSGTNTMAIRAGLEALETTPECYRVYDGLCEIAGVSLGHSVTLDGISTLSEQLYPRLKAMPQLPPQAALIVKTQTQGRFWARILGGQRATFARDFKARALLMDTLLAATDDRPAAKASSDEKKDDNDASRPTTPAQSDPAEPSWATLGLLVRELSFVQVYRRARFMHRRWSVPTDEFLATSKPLYAKHPYSAIIDTQTSDPQVVDAAFERLGKVETLGIELQGKYIATVFWRRGKGRQTWGVIWDNMDDTAREMRMAWQRLNKEYRVPVCRRLLAISPHSPFAKSVLMSDDHDNVKDQIPRWEKEEHKHPILLRHFAGFHSKKKDFGEAVRLMNVAVKIDPSFENHKYLAGIYENQGNRKMWLSTLEAFFNQPDYGLQHANIRSTIAGHYMAHKQWAVAQPYAEAAAQSYAGWALNRAAQCAEALQDWERAEFLYRAVTTRYQFSSTVWYRFCRRTNQGDVQAARDWAEQKWIDPAVERRFGKSFHRAMFHELENEPERALPVYQADYDRTKKPMSGLHAALVADELYDANTRDAILARVIKGRGGATVGLASLIADDLAKGGTGRISLAAVERLRSQAGETERLGLDYLAGKYFSLHGRPDQAIRLWKRVMIDHHIGDRNRTFAGAALAESGFTPEAYKEGLQTPIAEAKKAP